MKSKIINVLETFSGIGAQHKAIKKIGIKGKIFNIKATADWDARANIAYTAIHHDLLKNFKQVLQSKKLDNEQQIDLFLSNYAISLDSKKQSKLNGKDIIFKQHLAAWIILANNQVDITKMNGNIIEKEKIDLVTYSFPCQGLSVANMGRVNGINKLILVKAKRKTNLFGHRIKK
ncbi:C-5 cytosine-specific DNA methylase [Mycoplasmopsis bovigenitalium]|uniref:C-5 cytosine-specific DNA methylase n=1 Tax=Mycoplasmopsis bovigenitalium TaxID=2112 RepID=A0A449A9I4_9BACT|nr:DNA cytosine methyltransferase [Mycoplasmopsis bovigenitalium]VEU60842.1 C-5 cytosine-specific DNA methylase [Mycoplasmopsis bovigenitalium]